eukprot:10586-Heterococcus_DN1.PRE.1
MSSADVLAASNSIRCANACSHWLGSTLVVLQQLANRVCLSAFNSWHCGRAAAGSLGLAYVLGHAVGLELVEIPVAMFAGAHK